MTADSWGSWEIAHATFIQFIAGGEKWSASFGVDTQVPAFEFVVFCAMAGRRPSAAVDGRWRSHHDYDDCHRAGGDP